MKDVIKAGIVQMEVLADSFDRRIREKNVERAMELIHLLCKDQQLDIIVLPEEFYSGSGYGPISMPDPIEKIEVGLLKKLGELARKYNVYIAGEVLAKHDPNGFKSNNTGFIIDREGRCLGFQERLHLNTREQEFCSSGNAYQIFELDFGKVGMVLGMDILYPEVSRNFVLQGAEIIINPFLAPGGINTSDRNETYLNNLYKTCICSRAMENQIYVISVNGVGDYVHVDKNIFGGSMIVGPMGEIYRADHNEVTAFAELNLLDKVKATRQMQLREQRNAKVCLIEM